MERRTRRAISAPRRPVDLVRSEMIHSLEAQRVGNGVTAWIHGYHHIPTPVEINAEWLASNPGCAVIMFTSGAMRPLPLLLLPFLRDIKIDKLFFGAAAEIRKLS